MVSCGKLKQFLKALLARCLFAAHSVITIWRVTEVKSEKSVALYYLLVTPVCLLPIEMIITGKFADQWEWKWFCPSVLLYLASVVPGLWLLQFDLYNKRIKYLNETGLEDCSGDVPYNSSGLTSNVAGIQISVPLNLDDDVWAIALEQILIVLLIVGRWLLPKGALTREQLSELLLVYIGMGADILEFFGETQTEDAVICNNLLITIILVIWSWSLSQFTLQYTAIYHGIIDTHSTDGLYTCKMAGKSAAPMYTKRRKSLVSGGMGGCCGSQTWALCIFIVMQDGPFLATRLYLIIAHNASSQLLLFFTIKNFLVILLQLYRIAILRCPSLFPGESGGRPDVESQQEGEEEPTGKSNEGFQAADGDDGVELKEENYNGDQRASVIGTNM